MQKNTEVALGERRRKKKKEKNIDSWQSDAAAVSVCLLSQAERSGEKVLTEKNGRREQRNKGKKKKGLWASMLGRLASPKKKRDGEG